MRQKMKKLFIAIILIRLTFPVFAQNAPPANDPRAKFQGIWYGVVYGEDKVFFVFIDDFFICNLDYGFSYKYLVEDHDLILTSGRFLGLDGWDNQQYENGIDKIQYIFSGDKLLLIFDGEPITLSKNYEDFPEWR
jgi:hypothetical protein